MAETSQCPACGAPVTASARQTGRCEFCNTSIPGIQIQEPIPDAFAASAAPEVITPPDYSSGQHEATSAEVQDVVTQVKSAVNASQLGTKLRNIIILIVLAVIMSCALCVGLMSLIRNGQ